MSLTQDVRKVLELAEAYTLEADVPQELKEAVHFCIAKQWMHIKPVHALLKLNPTKGGGLFPERRTVLIGPDHCPKRLLLKADGELALSTDRLGGVTTARTDEAENASEGKDGVKRAGRPRTGETDTDSLVIAALAAHHQYEPGGSVVNHDPAVVRGLAKKYGPTTAAISRFLKDKFEDGHKGYVAACQKEEIAYKFLLRKGCFSDCGKGRTIEKGRLRTLDYQQGGN